jgi:hypothetical protein
MISKQATIECPFCKQVGVKAYHIPSFLQATTSRISAGARTKYHRVPEHYEVLSGCPSCGKSKKEIDDYFEGRREVPLEERLRRLRESGLPTRIETKRAH